MGWKHMPEVELRLYRTRGSKRYDAVPIHSLIALEVWSKGTFPKKGGEVTIEGEDIRFPQRIARVHAAPLLDPAFALVEDVTSSEEQQVGIRHHHIKPPGIVGLWPLISTDHFSFGDKTYQRAEIFVFAN